MRAENRRYLMIQGLQSEPYRGLKMCAPRCDIRRDEEGIESESLRVARVAINGKFGLYRDYK